MNPDSIFHITSPLYTSSGPTKAAPIASSVMTPTARPARAAGRGRRRRKRSEGCTSGARAPPPPRACCERLRRLRIKRSFKRGTAQVSMRRQQPLIGGTWWDVWKCNFLDRWVAWWGSHVPAGGAGSESDDVGVARPPLPYIHILAGCPLFMLNPSFLRRCAPTVCWG